MDLYLFPQFKKLIYLTNLTSNGEIPAEGMAGCNLIQPLDQSITNLIYIRLIRGLSSQVLKIFKDGGSSIFWATC